MWCVWLELEAAQQAYAVACTARAGARKMKGCRRKQNEASKRQTGPTSARMISARSFGVRYIGTLERPTLWEKTALFGA
jgi:hypothetical protein